MVEGDSVGALTIIVESANVQRKLQLPMSPTEVNFQLNIYQQLNSVTIQVNPQVSSFLEL